MPQISSNFILRSKLPNFERDSFQTWNEMINVPTSWIDEGHISYCVERNKHYIFNSANGTLEGDARWTRLDIPVNIQADRSITSVPSIDKLTDSLAESLSTGDLVYVINDMTFYYNTYDSTKEVQSIDYREDNTGWFWPLFEGYATEEWVKNCKYLTKHQDISHLAQKENVYSIGSANEKFATRESLSDYAKIGSVYTISEVNNLFTDTEKKIPSLDGYATEKYVNEQGFLTKHQDISHLAQKENVYSIGSTNEKFATIESLSDYAKIENVYTISEVNNLFADTEKKIPSLDGYATEEYVNEQGFLTEHQDISHLALKDEIPSLDGYATIEELSEYVKAEDVPIIENVVLKDDLINYAKLEELDPLKDQISTISAATGAFKAELNTYKEEVAETYATKTNLNDYVKWDVFQNNSATTTNRIIDVENDIKGVKVNIENIQNDNSLNEYKEEVAETYATKDELENHINNFEEYKKLVDETYAKPEDISSKLNTYAPSVEHENRWIGADCAGDLAGKTGKEVANSAYSYSAVFDQMLFSKFTPTTSYPSVDIDLKHNWNGGMSIDWYDEKKRIILVEAGCTGPDGGDFEAVNVKDAIITYPKGIDLSTNFTNGLIPSTDEKQTSIGFCKVKDENDEWVYYRKENNIYHVPAILNVGEYRYHMAAYFQKGSPALDNDGMTVTEWNENTPIESDDYITIIASKPTYYNTNEGFTKNRLILWGDEMIDYMTLKPSCQLEQAFKLPRKIKELYIWNDISGYAKVPMVYQKDENGLLTKNLIPAYFTESVDENDYYTYIYNSNENGHRGEIKIKVTF